MQKMFLEVPCVEAKNYLIFESIHSYLFTLYQIISQVDNNRIYFVIIYDSYHCSQLFCFLPLNADSLIAINLIMLQPTNINKPAIETSHCSTQSEGNQSKTTIQDLSRKKQSCFLIQTRRIKCKITSCQAKLKYNLGMLTQAHNYRVCLENELKCGKETAYNKFPWIHVYDLKLEMIELTKNAAFEISYEISRLETKIKELKQEKRKYDHLIRKLYHVQIIRA